MTRLDELIERPEAGWNLSEPEAVAMLGKVAALEAVLRARLARHEPPAPAPSANGQQANGDRLLDAEEVALRLGVSVDAVYRMRLPFAVKLGRRRTRYSEHGLQELMRAQGQKRVKT